MSRPWAVPGTPGLEHRIGGLSSEDVTGNISYSPANNELMVRTRARKIAGIAREIPPTEIFGDKIVERLNFIQLRGQAFGEFFRFGANFR